MKFTPLLIGMFSMIPLCKSAPFPKSPDGKHIPNHKVVVDEVIQTTSYTYLHVKENDTLRWLAIPSMQASKGDTYYYSEGLPMKQFESKELHKTFDEVLFLGGVSAVPVGSNPTTITGNATDAHGQSAGAQPYTRKTTQEVKKSITIVAPKDCITIAELFSKKDFYAGKTIKIKGEVTKYNPEIMNKNWIHLQDGTENNGKFDLVITSGGTVRPGDIVTLEGKITLNKDFGYGYLFDVMMEEGVVK